MMWPLEEVLVFENLVNSQEGWCSEKNVWATLHCKGRWRRFWRHHILPLTFPFFGIGDSNLAPQLAVLCGRELPGPIRSTGEYMFLRLTSDFSVTAAGFNASFHKSNMFRVFFISHHVFSLHPLSLSFSLIPSAYFSHGSHPASGWLSFVSY